MRSKSQGVVGYLRGGLANQLFISATAYAVNKRLGTPLALDLSYLKRKRAHAGDVDHLGFDAEIVRGSPEWFSKEPWHLRRLGRRATRVLKVFVERSFAYDPDIDSVKPGTTLLGYFQSWRYFDEVGDDLRRILTNVTDPTPWYTDTSRRLADEGDWIGVHVRQGDYLQPDVARLHGTVTSAYIDRALDLLSRMGHRGRLVVFSDSPDRVSSFSARLGDALVIDAPSDSHPIESLNLMSQASALVTSNSSFSWWAGYLGERPNRPVISPRPWFGDITHDTRDLLLPAWIAMERRDLS